MNPGGIISFLLNYDSAHKIQCNFVSSGVDSFWANQRGGKVTTLTDSLKEWAMRFPNSFCVFVCVCIYEDVSVFVSNVFPQHTISTPCGGGVVVVG